jgi:hypothetical protein
MWKPVSSDGVRRPHTPTPVSELFTVIYVPIGLGVPIGFLERIGRNLVDAGRGNDE